MFKLTENGYKLACFFIQKNNRGKMNPSECFKFKVEEKVQCSVSKKVKYTDRTDYLIGLPISMDMVTNKGKIISF